MTIIKICGLRTVEHALVAAEAGADLLGVIFAPSRRQVTVEQAATIANAVAHAPIARKPGIVGVFVNESAEYMLEVARACRLSAVQLSGDEPTAIKAQLNGLQLIKAVRLTGDANEQAWLAEAGAVRLMIESHLPGSYGGTGVVGDWAQAAHLASQYEIILAGGLTPENVAPAIGQVHPWGVDVSSGIETEGIKDNAKIRAFIAAVRAA